MIRPFISSAAVILLTASALPAQDWAQKLFPVKEHNFGSVARGAKAEYEFVLTNSYIPDLHIASVRTSCGCTTPKIKDDKSTLKTYESGAVLAHLNSDTFLGPHAATLTVTIDKPYYAEVQLQVRANIHTDVLMEPSEIQFGSVQQGKPAQAQVRLYRANMPGWEIQHVGFSDPNLRGELVPVARQGSQTWYDLKVQLAPTAPVGYIADHAVLTTNDPYMAQMPIQIEGLVRPSVVVSPSDLFLGVLRSGQKVTKQLIVRADKPFRIKSITGDKGYFVIPPAPTEASSVHVLPVTFIASQTEMGKVVKTIHIDTDLGATQATSYAVVNEEK